MTRLEIEELVTKKKQELQEEYVHSDKYFYCKRFLDNNKIISPEDFINIDIAYLLRCFYLIHTKTKSIEEVEEFFDSFIAVLSNYAELNLVVLINMCDSYLNPEIDDIPEEEKLNDMKSVLIMAQDETQSSVKVKIGGRKNKTKKIELEDFLDYLNDIGVPFITIIAIYKAYYDMKEHTDEFIEEANQTTLKDKEKERIYKKSLKGSFAISRLLKDINRIQNFVKDEEKEEKQYNRNSKKELLNLDKAMTLLDQELNNVEVCRIREIADSIKDLNIKYNVLELIKEHNSKYYEKLNLEYQALNQNSKIKYQSLLGEFGISKNTYQVSTIMHNSLEDVSDILTIISKFKLTKEQMVKILTHTNKKIVEEIKNYIDKGYLNIEFISTNIDIFYEDSTKLNTYNSFLDIINIYNLNPSIFSNDLELLLNNYEIVKNNIIILDEYNLINSLKKTNNYKFLSDSEVVIKIDRFIELGYSSILEDNLELLNSDKMKRLELLHSLNIPVTEDEIKDILFNNKFFLEDSKLDDYLLNTIPYMNDDIEISIDDLEEFRDNNRTYNVDGIIISSNKVKRLINDNYSCFEAMLYNCSFNSDEYQTLIKALKPYIYKK